MSFSVGFLKVLVPTALVGSAGGYGIYTINGSGGQIVKAKRYQRQQGSTDSFQVEGEVTIVVPRDYVQYEREYLGKKTITFEESTGKTCWNSRINEETGKNYVFNLSVGTNWTDFTKLPRCQ